MTAPDRLGRIRRSARAAMAGVPPEHQADREDIFRVADVLELLDTIERVEALQHDLAHPDPDLIVAAERAVHRNLARDLRHALDGCEECVRGERPGS